ncbi:MAG: sigma-54 interaction domain-containing protein [Dethiobacteria bacterium]|jgi:PAS domain S-box-containing protein
MAPVKVSDHFNDSSDREKKYIGCSHNNHDLPMVKSSTLLDAILDTSFDAIVVVDKNGVILKISSSYQRLNAISPNMVLGKTVDQIVREGLTSTVVTPLVLKNKKTVSTKCRLLHSGKEVLLTGSPVVNKSGEVEFVVINMRDVTELGFLHEELERSKKLIRQYDGQLRQMKLISDKWIGKSQASQKLRDLIMTVANYDSIVLITGESGVGKGVVARLIHDIHFKENAPFIHVNCGAIPETLAESEFFGYAPGAFTSASKAGKKGYFELAHNGTLFLDEIGELPLNLQAKLLKVMDDKAFYRIGSESITKVSTRIITATNRDLEELVNKGTFRQDLFYRINVIPINVPPLKERRYDIAPLVTYYLQKYCAQYDKKMTLAPATMELLESYNWPGNVREISNVIERLVIFSTKTEIGIDDLPESIQKSKNIYSTDRSHEHDGNNGLQEALDNVEFKIIKSTLATSRSIREAARSLGISHSTLLRRMDKMGIK